MYEASIPLLHQNHIRVQTTPINFASFRKDKIYESILLPLNLHSTIHFYIVLHSTSFSLQYERFKRFAHEVCSNVNLFGGVYFKFLPGVPKWNYEELNPFAGKIYLQCIHIHQFCLLVSTNHKEYKSIIKLNALQVD